MCGRKKLQMPQQMRLLLSVVCLSLPPPNQPCLEKIVSIFDSSVRTGCMRHNLLICVCVWSCVQRQRVCVRMFLPPISSLEKLISFCFVIGVFFRSTPFYNQNWSDCIQKDIINGVILKKIDFVCHS
jgi:hypothetical protein